MGQKTISLSKKWTGTPFRFKKKEPGTPFRCVPVQFEPCSSPSCNHPRCLRRLVNSRRLPSRPVPLKRSHCSCSAKWQLMNQAIADYSSASPGLSRSPNFLLPEAAVSQRVTQSYFTTHQLLTRQVVWACIYWRLYGIWWHMYKRRSML